MRSFLLYIGAYNALGSFVLLVFLSQRRAELVLGKWLQVLGQPYDHGAHGPMWILWSMMTNLGVGAAMVLASRWPAGAEQRDIALVALGVYAIGVFVALAGMRSPRYRVSGLVACVVLWVAQLGWGAYAVATA
jgi:hypothetical protein